MPRQGQAIWTKPAFRLASKTQWLHIASTALLTFYRVCAERGSLLAGVVGIVVHDHWKPYYTMTDVLHGLCNAHHLRELKALIELDHEDWARKMQILLRRTLPRHQSSPASVASRSNRDLIARIERRYDAIVAEGLAFHQAPAPVAQELQRRGANPRRVGHNLLLRLDQRQESDVLRFLHDPSVPFTNNQAETDARMMKLRQKISGGFRAQASATGPGHRVCITLKLRSMLRGSPPIACALVTRPLEVVKRAGCKAPAGGGGPKGRRDDMHRQGLYPKETTEEYRRAAPRPVPDAEVIAALVDPGKMKGPPPEASPSW